MSDNEKHKSGSGTESNDSASDSDSSSGSSEDGEYSSPEHSKRAVTSVVVSKTNIPNPRQLNNKKGLQEDDDESDHITTRSDDERQEKELEERRRERMERHRLRDEKDASRSKDEQNRNGGNERHRSRSRSNEKRRSRSNDRKRRSHSNDYKKQDDVKAAEDKSKQTARQKQVVEMLTSRTGGAYIPPAKLRLLQAEITDKSSAPYQRIAWEALKKSIHGYINKVNVDNIGIITRELLTENIIRGRGLLTRSIIQAQAASPTFTHVYAALVAIINSKFPNIGELLLQRLVIQFKRGFRRNDKMICLSSTRFIAHLVNQRVAHEILSLEILTLLVESPTDDSVEVAIAFLKECGQKLTEVSSKGVNAIFEMLKNILHEGKLDKRVQYMIEVVFQVRKDGFKDHIAVIEALELVEEDDQFTHLIMLDEATDSQDVLNVFKFDEDFETNENKYKGLSKELLGSDASDSEAESGSGDSSSEDSEAGGDDDEEKKDGGVIIDNTETNLVALRRTIYLTIHSSLDYEECAHKLMKMELKPGQEIELCHMFLDCCAEQRTYEKFYGLLAQRFCNINKVYVPPFEEIFKDTYHTTHRLDTNRLRNVSKFFAHLLFTDAIGWDVMDCIQLNEEDTTSSSRIFIKILFQELVEYMSLSKLNARLKDATLQESFSGLFPRDNPRNTRFAINFFTSIGLGGLTDELREHLKKAPKQAAPALPQGAAVVSVDSSSEDSSSDSSSSSDSESDSDDSSSSSSSDSSDSSSSSDNENRRKKKTSKKKKSASSKNDKKKKSGSSKKADFNKKKLRMDKKDKHKKKNRKNDEVPVRNQEPAVKRRNPFGDRNEMRQMSPSIEMQWGQRNQNAPAPKKRQQRDEHQRSPSAENLKKQRGNRQRSQSMENNRKEQPGSFVEKKRKQRQRSPSVEKKRKNQRDESPVAKKYQSRKYNDYSRSPSVEKRNRKQRDSPVMEKRNRRDQYDDHSRSRSVEKKSRKQQRDERPRSLSSDDERQRRVERYADNRKKDRNEKRHNPEERSRDDSPPTARKQKRRSRSVERNRRHYDDNDEDRHDRRRVSKERG